MPTDLDGSEVARQCAIEAAEDEAAREAPDVAASLAGVWRHASYKTQCTLNFYELSSACILSLLMLDGATVMSSALHAKISRYPVLCPKVAM